MAFNIESVPNQAGKPAILLREAWREGKRIRKRTVANLSKFPPEIVEGSYEPHSVKPFFPSPFKSMSKELLLLSCGALMSFLRKLEFRSYES